MSCNFPRQIIGGYIEEGMVFTIIIIGFVAATTGVNIADKGAIWDLFTFLFNFGVLIVRSVIK